MESGTSQGKWNWEETRTEQRDPNMGSARAASDKTEIPPNLESENLVWWEVPVPMVRDGNERGLKGALPTQPSPE